jgi:hypothetical protein
MPLLRYFIFVGGTLLALLFISDAVLPGQSLPGYMNAASSDLPPFRIRSDQKWPERIVFDTSLPTIKPAVVADISPANRPSAEIAAASQKADVREAFAQLAPSARNSGVKTESPGRQAVAKTQEARTQEARTQEAGTQDAGTLEARSQQAKPHAKRKVAKARTSRPMILVAQQPHYGLFESTW